MINRPISETKAVGSTFKAVTAIAALEEGVITPGTGYFCPGSYSSLYDNADPPQKFKCWAHGRPRDARPGRRHHAVLRRVLLQRRRPLLRAPGRRRSRTGPSASAWARPPASTSPASPRVACPRRTGRSSYFETEIDKIWKPGDSINLAVGQGDLEATPAAAGRHLRRRRQRRQGRHAAPRAQGRRRRRADRARRWSPRPPRKVDISQTTLDVVRRGLYEAAHNAGRHLGGRLRRLQGGGRRQDRHGRGLGRHVQALRRLRLVRELRARPTTPSTRSSS